MENSVEEGKTIAITSYILIVGVPIAMSMNSENKNSFASFHIRQSLGISLTFISLGLIISNFNPFNYGANVDFGFCIDDLWNS